MEPATQPALTAFQPVRSCVRMSNWVIRRPATAHISVQENSFQPEQHGVSDDATIGFDADGRVLSVSRSAATALGYSQPEELRGVPLARLIGDGAAISLLDRVVAAVEFGQGAGGTADPQFTDAPGSAVTFIRHDGSRVSLNTVVTPETSGGWITLLDPASGGKTSTEQVSGFSAPFNVAAILRKLAEQTASIGDVSEITSRFATELVVASGAETVTVARSSAISGIYEPMARVSGPDASSLTETIDLPPALVPQQGSGPIAVESLETLALFEPVIIYGEEFDGAYIAARSDLHDGAHLLVIATAASGKVWSEPATLLFESGVLTLAGTLRAAELDRRIASYSRASETVRQIGALASRDHDGGFLDAARKIIARRLPVSAISIHVADPVTGRCYVPDASSAGDEEYGALAPGVEWQLAGSIEQRVLKTGAAVFTSAASSERLSVPPATIAHWRRSGLQAVAAIPLREAGEVVAIMLAGFSSPVSDPKETIRLLESIAPAVHLGVGLSAGRPGVAQEPDDAEDDAGFVSPKVLLAITRAAAESPDPATLFASVSEWMLEIIPSARIAWGTVDRSANTYHRLYSYDSTSAAHTEELTKQLENDELGSLDIAGLGLPEPGYSQGYAAQSYAGSEGSMRAVVTADHRVLAVVTVWPREDQLFNSSNLARLERICEFISGPLNRILETESVRGAQRKRDQVTEIGTLAAEFTDPAQALRALRSKICKLFPHDRTLFVEFDHIDGIATLRYDSATLPTETEPVLLAVGELPSPDMAVAEAPVSLSLTNSISGAEAGEPHPIFAGSGSLLAIPLRANDGRDCALIMLSETTRTATNEQVQLAASLSAELRGAMAGWQAYASTRDLRRDVIDIRKQLSLVLDSAPIALITTDVDGVCHALEGHGLETLGIKREDMHGRSIFELTRDLPQLEEAVKLALRGEIASVLTSLGAHSVEVWAQPATETDGTIKGITLVGYDVSDRVRSKRANAEKRDLKATLQEREDIIERASHELRNQLQSIIAYSDILSVGAGGKLTQSQVHALSVIQKTADKLDTMIGDLPGLDYKIGLSAVDVTSLMREIVDAQEPIFTSAEQQLTLALPYDLYTLQADHLRLTQVVTNLLSNASKYSPHGAAVSVDVTVEKDILYISVSDTGPGIPADQLERVWDTGIRLATSDTSAVKGSGLGLAIARKIVEMHGGKASIESEVGFGTTVTVALPGAKLLEQPPDQSDDEDVTSVAVDGSPETAPDQASNETGEPAGRRHRARRATTTKAKTKPAAAPRKRRSRRH